MVEARRVVGYLAAGMRQVGHSFGAALASIVHHVTEGEQLVAVGPHAVGRIHAGRRIGMHLVHAVFFALCLGLGVFTLDDDVDVLLGVRFSRLPDGDVDRFSVAAELDRLLDPDLLLLVTVLTHEGL